jgi:hypothetical protein
MADGSHRRLDRVQIGDEIYGTQAFARALDRLVDEAVAVAARTVRVAVPVCVSVVVVVRMLVRVVGVVREQVVGGHA